MTTRRLLIASLVYLLAVFAPVSVAEVPAEVSTQVPHVRAELIAEASIVAPGDSFRLLVMQQIDEGWHTYWKNP